MSVAQRKRSGRRLPLAACWLAGSVTLSMALAHAGSAHADADPWFAKDKALHFSACFMAAGDGYATAAVLDKGDAHPWLRALTGLGLALAAGAAKEVYDSAGGGDASLRDFTWDIVGAATGVAISWMIDRYLF